MKRKTTDEKGYWIVPVRQTIHGFMYAPAIHVSMAESGTGDKAYSNAVAIAKERSGLSRFASWKFI
jgi:hypothetical protein